jgi:hypothetical protein
LNVASSPRTKAAFSPFESLAPEWFGITV